MKPQYYWDILALLEERKMFDTIVSFTTNLWDFYKKPDKWVELFKHPQVGITTSFQYGRARLKPDLTPYTEAEFWTISDMMLDLVGYRPSFIAVITPENEDTVIQTVELAKKMKVMCKVNYAMSSGPQTEFKGIKIGNAGKPYLLADIYERYLEIHKAGLTEWEYNTQQMISVMNSVPTTCPLSRDCDSSIRTLQPNGDYYSCGSFGDDKKNPIDFEAEMAGGFFRPLDKFEYMSLKTSCFTCPMYQICNGCRKTIDDLKSTGNVEKHCVKMKSIAQQIIDVAGLNGIVTTTEYINENP